MRLSLILCTLLSLSVLSVLATPPDVQIIDNFNAGLNEGWEVNEFNGQTEYTVIDLVGEKVLMAKSSGTASALIFHKKYSLSDYPILSWRWKVENILDKGDAHTKNGDDYAVRVFVVFPHWILPMTRSINYIWANKLPQGSIFRNIHVPNATMLAVQSGPENIGRWMSESRNVRKDYQRIFGEEPPAVGAIAIMTDTDDTGETALGWYDDIRIEKDSSPHIK